MSPDNVREFVNRLLAAFAAGGIESLAEFYSPDYVNHTPFPGATNDLAGHAAFISAAAPHLEFLSNEPLEIVADEDKASVLTKSQFRARRTGEEFEAFGFSVVRFGNGKIIENWGGYDPIAVSRMMAAGVVIPQN